MKNLAIIILLALGLVGCDKDASEVENDATIRLSVEVYNSIRYSSEKDTNFTFKLYEESLNKGSGTKQSRHIQVSTPGTFTLELDGVSHDLSDYYYSGSSIYGGDGSYSFDLYDVGQSVKSVKVSLNLNGKQYRFNTSLPRHTVITNYAQLSEEFDPLNDDILIDWGATDLPLTIEGQQNVYSNDKQYCAKDTYSYTAPVGILSHNITNDALTQGCDEFTQDLREINTEVTITQKTSDLSFKSTGFDSVSIVFENRYRWSETTKY